MQNIHLNEQAVRRHNACSVVLGPMIETAAMGLNQTRQEDVALQWMILESLCIYIGLSHGATDRHIAEQIEVMAQRIVSGERVIDRSLI